MQKRNKRQLLAAMAAMALLVPVGGVSNAADKDHILVQDEDLNSDLVVGSKPDYFYGVYGGKLYSDSVLDGIVHDTIFPEFSDKVTIGNGTTTSPVGKEIGLQLTASKLGTEPSIRYYGAIGGDLLINSNATLISGDQTAGGKDASLTAAIQGNIINTANTGTIIGGVGGSAAVGIGNISADALWGTLRVKTGGTAETIVDGNITTTVGIDKEKSTSANLLGFMNGGLAAGIGGDATSVVTGDTELNIVGTNRTTNDDTRPPADDFIHQVSTAINVMNGSNISAIGVTGGGAAVSTLGSTATSTVGGNASINITNATVIGAVGGGVAASVDATDIGDKLLDKWKPGHSPVGNDDGTSGFGVTYDKNNGVSIVTGAEEDAALAHVDISNVNQGGTATSVTGDTYLSVTSEGDGNSTAIGVFGGGAAVATHTYIGKTGENEGKVVGASHASATTGKATITVNLQNKLQESDKSAFMGALGDFKTQLGPEESMNYKVLAPIANKGAVGAVFGGGASLAYGSIGTAYDPDSRDVKGAYAKAETAGADINLVNGYAAGIMGGGIAGVRGNAYAESIMTDTVNINIGNFDDTLIDEETKNRVGAEAVGVFGNGLAYYTGNSAYGEKNLTGQAVVTAENTNINVAGMADGLIGGGMAIDDSQSNTVNAKVQTNGTAAINVYEGAQIGKVGLEALTELVGNVPNEGQQVDMASYVDGVNEAAGNAAIAAGGIALGGGADAYVKDAVVNIAGGEVTGDIYGGGIAAYGYAGKTSEDGTVAANGGSRVGNSTINLIGGTVNGNIYAGGAVSVNDKTKRGYTSAIATVDKATVNLAGADVTGILYGTGTVDQRVLADTATNDQKAQVAVKDSTLNLLGKNTLNTVAAGTAGAAAESSKIQDFKNVVAKNGSETVLDEEFAGTTALISGGKMTAESGAYLNIDAQAKKSRGTETYLVASNMAEGSQLWKDDAFTYDRMGTVYADDVVGDDGSYSVEFKTVEGNEAEAAASMAGRLGADELQNSLKEAMGNWNNGNKVNQAARDYIYDWQMSSNPGLYKRGMMIGEDAAVTGNTVSIARDMADNVIQRLSFTDDYVQDAGWVNNDGGIWAKYIHRKYETEGMGSSFGGIHSSTDYDGAIVGVDFAKHGNFQSGVAFHYGSGDGNGLISRNDYDAWGFTLYGSLKDEEAGTNLMADIGYVTSDNDIDGTVENHRLSADRDVDAWTIGLRGEKEYVFGQNQLVPYVGLRYMSVNPARYSVSVDGKSTFGMDADNQNLWLLPIGVSFRNETVTDGGWRITPKLDLSYIWAFGDTDTDVDVNFVNGVSSGLYYDVMDDNSWLASLGVEATKDVWSFGVGYGYQKGDDTKNKTWFVNASYAF